MLPDNIENDYLKVKTIFKPSNKLVSGDSYDFIWNSKQKIFTGCILDVMGHGIATFLQTSILRVLISQANEVTLKSLGRSLF